MPSSYFKTTSSSCSCFTHDLKSSSVSLSNVKTFNFCARFRPTRENGRKLLFRALKCSRSSDPCSRSSLMVHTQSPSLSFSCPATAEAAVATADLVADKLQRLVVEFRSLTEPIDRVKQLLHYAAILPPFDEGSRLPANRVTGCTTQVWLDAKLDEFGRVRFRADSDSEITKGFCSCLIWMLDGAEPEEVLAVEPDDLAAMNVGLHGKAQSRVNTWHNVLISMQKRTKDLVEEREETPSFEPFPALVMAAADGTGSYAKAQYFFISKRANTGARTKLICRLMSVSAPYHVAFQVLDHCTDCSRRRYRPDCYMTYHRVISQIESEEDAEIPVHNYHVMHTKRNRAVNAISI